MAHWLGGLYFADPEPLTITVDMFPTYIGALERSDLSAAKTGGTAAGEGFEADFEAQRERYRFAYGGDGATMDYSQFQLTIVNGYQPLPLPSGTGETTGNSPPILASLDTGPVSCVFVPAVSLYDSAVLRSSADLTASGWTQCVLNDEERHISAGITSLVPGGASETSTRFAKILESTHADLVKQQ